MEGDAYLNGSLLLSTIMIQPFTICLSFIISNTTVSELSIDRCPVHLSYIFQAVSWMPNNIKKHPKAHLGLLMPLIPISIPQ